MKKFLTILLLSIAIKHIRAQDPHFSQFFASPLTLNPAFTGKFNGNYRVAANHRNQWPTINNAFITSTASVDFHIMQSNISSNDMWGVGLMGMSDNSAGSAVRQNYFSFSTAYHKGLDEEGIHQLGFGIQATYANMFINTAGLKFEDQLTATGFTGISSEIFNNATLQNSYFDLNAGLLYNGSTSERNNFYAGISVYHINRPQQQFTGALFNLNPRATFHAGGYFPMGEITTMHISGLHSTQGNANETVMGGAMQITPNPLNYNPFSLYVGSWIRFKDAIIPYVGIEYNNFRLGMTYDINTSSLKTASQRMGGFEVSLIFTNQPNTDKPINCPKF